MSYVTSYITDETSWTTDYQALMKEFDDIKEKWISVLEKQGLPIECYDAMNFNRLVSLANWVGNVRKFHTKWGLEMMTETLKGYASAAEKEVNIDNPIDYH